MEYLYAFDGLVALAGLMNVVRVAIVLRREDAEMNSLHLEYWRERRFGETWTF